MIDPKAIEQSIVDRLSPVYSKIDVEVIALPDNLDEYKDPARLGRVTVAYHSSRYDSPTFVGGGLDPTGTGRMRGGTITQMQDPEFQIVFEARSRHGANGVLDLMEVCKRLLVGFIPGDPNLVGKLYPVEDGYLGDAKGFWSHGITFALQAKLIEPADYYTVNP